MARGDETRARGEGYFDEDAVLRKVFGSRLVALAGSRAVVLQLAHPAIAQAVTDFSQFEVNPWPRLWRTFKTVHTVVFGTKAEADLWLTGVGRGHAAVQGVISRATSVRHVGTPYSALDPDAQLWVLATFADTAWVMYEELFAPLTDGEKEMLWQDWRRFGALFGLPETHGPQTWDAFRVYMDAMLEGTGDAAQVLELEGRTVQRLSRHLFGLWASRVLGTAALTRALLPPRFHPLVPVWPPVAVTWRGRALLALWRTLARSGRARR